MSLTLDRPITYLITRGEATSENFDAAKRQILDIIAIAVEQRVSMVQIREKQLPARSLCDLVEAVVRQTSGTSTKILLNDRVDIAIGCGADGVQLTSTSIAANEIRRIVPHGFVVGVSAHSLDDVRIAVGQGADFALLAPIFATPGKGEPLGLGVLTRICDLARPFPVLALGGIDENNFQNVVKAGASGFAAIRAMNDKESLLLIFERLR